MNKRMKEADPAATSISQKVGWRPVEWGEAVGVCRATVYNLLDDGSIKSVKVGAARVIVTSPSDYLKSLRSVA